MERTLARDTDYELGKYTRSFGLSVAITSLISTLVVIVKETHEDTVLAWMKAATGHHWVTHGILNLILFIVFGWLLARLNGGQGINIKPRLMVMSIVAALIVNVLVTAGFYAH